MLTSRAKSGKSQMCYLWMWKQLPNFVIQVVSVLGKRAEHWGWGLGLLTPASGLVWVFSAVRVRGEVSGTVPFL